MKPKLQIKTQLQQEDEGEEPVSPTGQYLNSKIGQLYITAVLESEIPIDDSCAMDLLQNVFLPINRRFSSVMVSNGKGGKNWKRVEVNPQDHIKVPEPPEGLSIEEYDDHFDKYLTKIAKDPLPQDRPLWEIHITKYPTSKAAGHLIFKLHHALGDGFSLMGALLSCMQRADNPSLPLTFPSLQRSSKANSTTMNLIRCVPRTLGPIYYTISDFIKSGLKSTLIADDKTPIRSGDATCTHPIKISIVVLSLDQISNIKKTLGVTVNDVLTGTIFLGTRLYMQEKGKGFGNSKSTVMVVLNTRNINGYKSVQEMLKPATNSKWGNKFTYFYVGIPKLTNNQSSSPLDFVAHAKKIIKRKRKSLGVYLTAHILDMIRKLRGSEAATQLMYTTFNNTSMTISNVMGPVEKMALANHPCKGVYYIAVGIPQSIVITILSYMRTLRVGIVAEEGCVDLQRFSSCIENAFELIYKAAYETVPGT